jgi:hypothetical protein
MPKFLVFEAQGFITSPVCQPSIFLPGKWQKLPNNLKDIALSVSSLYLWLVQEIVFKNSNLKLVAIWQQ